MLITFEGIDGSGKSTQIERLVSYLNDQGVDTATFREPGGTVVSEKIRELLLDSPHELDDMTELLLFSAARSQLIKEKVLPLLEQGYVVILDRYYDSTTAYQGYGRESVELENIHHINRLASHRVSPDLTFYLKLGLKEGRERSGKGGPDRMEQSDDEFFERVIRGFDELAEQHSRFITIDATEEEEKVAKQVREKVVKHLELPD